jgi:hypothetical protein
MRALFERDALQVERNAYTVRRKGQPEGVKDQHAALRRVFS